MPSWKKVIISGSRAELSSVFATSITGSLQGTASFAVSASQAVTASYITGSRVFGPYGANSVITSSYAATASYAATSSFSLATSANQLLVINKSGATIAKGVVVHLTGSTNSSDTPYITTASYESDNLSANSLGITAESIAFNNTGYVTTEGVLTGLNVTGFIAGQVVYLGSNGAIIGSAPIAPLHSVRLGQVVRDSPTNNGSIYVRIDNGYEIGELHDVIDSTTTASFGELLVKSGSVWTTGKQLTGSYGLTGSLTVTGSTTTDLVRITQTGTGNAFKVEDSTNPDNTPFIIDNVGNVMIGTTSSKGEVTIAANGADGLVLDIDTASNTQSSRLFFKNSGSLADFSIRNTGQLLVIAAEASASVSSGTGRMYISASGDVSIGTGYSPSATRGAALQVSGSINIEEGFAYKQDGENVIYIQRNTGLTTGAFNNTIAGMDAAAGTAYFDQMTAFGYTALYQSSGSDQTAVGYVAGAFNTGSSQTLIGWGAGYQGKASNQTAVGEQAGWQNTGSNQTAIGIRAGYGNSGSNQTAIGADAGVRNTATQQVAVGLQAGIDNIGVAQTAIGQQAGSNNSGSTQTAVGYASGFENSGSLQVAIGAQAGRDNKGDFQTVTGYESGRLNIADYQTAAGYRAGYANTGSNQTAIGSLAGRFNSGSNQTALGVSAGEQNIGNTQTAIGAYAGYANTGSSQTVMGYEAGRDNIADFQTAVGYSTGYANTGSAQTAYGYQAGTYNSGSNQTATGFQAGVRNLALNQTATGWQAGYQNTGSNQTVTGYQAGFNNSGLNQVAMGNSAGESNRGNNQTALGSQAGFLNSGSNQTAVGYAAGYQNSGSDNTNIGYQAGTYTTGVTINTGSAQSVFLGSQTTAGGGNRTNQIVIGYDAAGIGSNSVVLGNSSIQTTALRGFIGIGTTTPTASLHVNNTTTSASFLVEDSTSPDGTPFIIDAAGNVGIGTTTPSHKLHLYNNAYTLLLLERSGSLNAPIQYTNSVGTFYAGISSNGKFTIGGNPDLTVEASAYLNVLPAGNVGINTTTPLGKLTVSGSGGYLSYNDTNTAGNLLVLSGSSDELVRIDVSALSASVNTAVSYGIRGVNDTGYPGYGKVTDAFMYASNFANGLNIINYGEGIKEDYIRFYAGTSATATPNIHIQGSGSNKGFIGINKIDPITQLDVNGNTLISGLLTVGSSSLGANENTLTLGARDNGSEGGQLGLNAPGGTYTSASMIDNYQNRFRILRGTNASSDAEYFNLNLHSGQVTFNKYTGSGAFPGTAAGYLAFDSAGNILTTAGVAAAATPGGNDTEIQYNNAGALAGTSAITFDGTTLRATGSFTGSLIGILTGTASFATTASFAVSASRAVTASFALTSSFITASGVFGPFGANSVRSASFAATASYFNATIQTSGSSIYSTNPAAGPNFNTTRGIFIGTGSGLNSVGSDKIAIGTNAGKLNTGTETVAIGERAGESNSTDFQVAIGSNAGRSNSGEAQTTIGLGAGLYNTGDSQTAIGSGAGSSNTGHYQTAVGLQAGQNNIGVRQVAIGFNAGFDNSGDNQTAIGSGAGASNTGSNNVNIGYQAGSYVNIGAPGLNFSSSNSVFLGADTAAGGVARINQIVIGYGTEGIGSNSVIIGNTDIEVTALRGKVGVNKTTPNAQLDVNGDTIISGSLSILGVSGSSDAKIVKTAFGEYLDFEDYTSAIPTDHPIDVTYVAYKSGNNPIQVVPPHSLLNVRRYSGYNGSIYVPGFEEAIEVDGSFGWNSNSTPTSWYIRLGESGSVQPNIKMAVLSNPGDLWNNAVTGITNSASGTYQHQIRFYDPVAIAGDTRIIGDLQIESNFVDDDASNSINNKALIQAGLLYLSNNF